MVGRKAIYLKSKHQCHLSKLGEYVCRPNNRRKEIIMRVDVYPIIRQTLTLSKIVEREAFRMKPKHQCHLS